MLNKKMSLDKKNQGGTIRCTIVTDIGQFSIEESFRFLLKSPHFLLNLDSYINI